jgi:hypothetical protein
MTSKEKIAALNGAHAKYDVQIESVSSGQQGQFMFKAIVSIFDHTDKGAVITKKSSAYGFGPDVAVAQDSAIIKAIEGLGL